MGRCCGSGSPEALFAGCLLPGLRSAGYVGGWSGGNCGRRSYRSSRGRAARGTGGRLWGDHRCARVDDYWFGLLPPPDPSEQPALSASQRRNRQDPYSQEYQNFLHLPLLLKIKLLRRSRGCDQATLHHKNGCASATDNFLPLFSIPPRASRLNKGYNSIGREIQ